VTDWLAVCRAAGEAVARVLDDLPTRVEREPEVGTGMGGDETTVVDAEAEGAVLGVLEDAAADGATFTLVSEELGERAFGPGAETCWVVVDPIDGSLNAKRGLPIFALSIAVAEGPTMDDVVLGYLRDYGTGEEWTAVRGEGARLNGAPLDGLGPKDEVEILALEATTTGLIAEQLPSFVGAAVRTRVLGSLALSLCHLAAGRVDAVCSLKPARSVDIAAAQLLVRERGLAIDLPDAPPFGRAALDLEGRSRVIAAGTPERCAELWARLTARTDRA
jgi:myo-inositol-1(or 4)-monophosphatase